MAKESPDFNVYCEPIPFYPCPLNLIKTKNTIQILHELLKMHSDDNDENDENYGMRFTANFLRCVMPSYLYLDQIFKLQFDSLFTIIKVNHNEQLGLEKLIQIGNDILLNFDAVENIKEIDRWATSPDFNRDHYFSSQLGNILDSFPSKSYANCDSVLVISEIFNEQTDAISKSENQNIISLKNDLIEYFLIKLLWIGNTEEKQKALAYLKQSANLDYNTAKKWNEYWRNKFRKTM